MGNTILLADKSITIQKIVQLTFADDNYSIKCFSDGQSALESIRQVSPDLVLADISLPGKNGYELCQTLRNDPSFSVFAKTPVILLAGIYETMDEERAKQVEDKVKAVGANDVLSKPFDPLLLTTKVKDLMPKAAQAEKPVGASLSTEGLFHESSNMANDLFAAPASGDAKESGDLPFSEPPVDDSERTMMLPGVPSFSSQMFAEDSPFDKTDPARPINVESVSPENEVIFSEEQFQDSDNGQIPDMVPTGKFAEDIEERSEQIFEEFPGEAAAETESVFDEPDEERTLIVAAADEPFADVVSDISHSWTQGTGTEEESPFGLPEPVAPPAPEPQPEMEPPAAESAPSESTNITQEVQAVIAEVAEQERPMQEFPLSEAVHAAPETFEQDTWPGVAVNVKTDQPVDELFEGEAQQNTSAVADEAEELEPDRAEAASESNTAKEEQTAQQIAPVVAAPAANINVTEELVERIAERVLSKLSEKVVSEIVWQVVPDLAEKMIRRELEKLNAGEES